jgi:hypothetical protein
VATVSNQTTIVPGPTAIPAITQLPLAGDAKSAKTNPVGRYDVSVYSQEFLDKAERAALPQRPFPVPREGRLNSKILLVDTVTGVFFTIGESSLCVLKNPLWSRYTPPENLESRGQPVK